VNEVLECIKSYSAIFVECALYQIELVFSGDAATGMRDAATTLIRRLGQTARDTLADFEDAVDKDATKTLVLDGTVHMLTSYVINYVKFLLE